MSSGGGHNLRRDVQNLKLQQASVSRVNTGNQDSLPSESEQLRLMQDTVKTLQSQMDRQTHLLGEICTHSSHMVSLMQSQNDKLKEFHSLVLEHLLEIEFDVRRI